MLIFHAVRGSGGPSSEVRGSGRRRGGDDGAREVDNFLKGDESYGEMSHVPQNVGHELNQIAYID